MSAKKRFLCLFADKRSFDEARVIDRLGDAGLATVNLAIDAVEDNKTVAKSIETDSSVFRLSVKRQQRYGYTMAFKLQHHAHQISKTSNS